MSNQFINVKDQQFGAIGDGVANDTGAIQSAIDAAAPANGTVFFPPGTYNIDSAIILPLGVTLLGSGPHSTVIRSISSTENLITSNSAQMVTIRNLQLESLVPREGGAGIFFDSVEQYLIDNVRFIDCYDAATFLGCKLGIISKIRLAHGSAITNRGFFFQSCVSTHLNQLLIGGGAAVLPSSNAWIQIDSGCDTVIMNSIEAGAPYGAGRVLYLSNTLSPDSFPPRWVKVTNFVFEGSSGESPNPHAQNAIHIDDCLSLYLCNGYTATSNMGIAVEGGKDIRADQCEFIASDKHGAYLECAAGVTFTSCTFSDNSQMESNKYSGARITQKSSDILFENCYFGDRIARRNNKQKYAIDNDSTSTFAIGITTENLGTSEFGGPVAVRFMRRGSLVWSVANVPPTSGASSVGDIVWNSSPSPGGNIGWVCIGAGSPGVWKPFGEIGT